MSGAAASGAAGAPPESAAGVAGSEWRTFFVGPGCGWLDSSRLAAYLCEGNGPREGPPARAGTSQRPWPLSWRDGCGAAFLLASGRAPGVEVGFHERCLDQELRSTHR